MYGTMVARSKKICRLRSFKGPFFQVEGSRLEVAGLTWNLQPLTYNLF